MERNALIVHFDSHQMEYHQFLNVESAFIQAFKDYEHALVDGHCFRNGQCLIFIYPRNAWEPVIKDTLALLKLQGVLDEAVVAKRYKDKKEDEIVWPKKPKPWSHRFFNFKLQ